MIVGHLPAGYVASALLAARLATDEAARQRFIWAGMLGAIAPDFDMLYFHLADHRQHHHHTYWSHFPLVWGSALLVLAMWLCVARRNTIALLAFAFALNGFMHLLLDSIVGDIWWFAPFVDQSFALFTVPALYQPWWLNFVLHWSFALELAVVVWAVYFWKAHHASSPRQS